MHLQAVWIFAISTVVGPDRRFNVSHIPRLGSEHAQEGAGFTYLHPPGNNMAAEKTAMVSPKLLELEIMDWKSSG